MTATEQSIRKAILAAFGFVVLCFFWQIAGERGWGGATLPSFASVIRFLFEQNHRELFLRASSATFSVAATGYSIGAFLGIVLGIISHAFIAVRPGFDRFASLVNAVPQIAIAPIFILFLGGNGTGVALAALGTFFIIYVSTTIGLAQCSKAHADLFKSLGAGKLSTFARLEIFAALPTLTTGMRQAIPVSLVGTILGEWFGANHGLGLLMVSAMQNFALPLLWSAVLITMVSSITAFAFLGLLERLIYRRFT